ncbi:MAG: LysM peptidoglycan-binding domain-containing protein [Ilumatobacteraceae bacterium]
MRTLVALTAVGAMVLLGACGDDDDPAADEPLPSMFTTVPAVTTTLAPPTTQARFYEIKSGDTLSGIAASFGLPVEAIMSVNGITDPNRIVAGQVISLPLLSELPTTTVAAPVTTVPQPTAQPVITTIAP